MGNKVTRFCNVSVIGLVVVAFLSCGNEGRVADQAADGQDNASDMDSGEGDAAPHDASAFRVVEIDVETSATVRLAVQACAGLFNRERGGSIYTQTEENDAQWLEELTLTPSAVIGAVAFLDECLAAHPKCVRYAYDAQRKLLPNILTVGAALGAIPLDIDMAVTCDEVAFDATVEFEDSDTPYLATRHVYEHYLVGTTGLAMLNPGYDLHASDLSNPEITRDMSSVLVDFVFAEKLFVVFLVNGCCDLLSGCAGSSPENDVLHDIVNNSDWPRPVGIYGYNNSWLVGGYMHEAQTGCLASRNMGAIPTETPNLSFFATRRQASEQSDAVEGNEPETLEYDTNKTYVAFVVGDGDNIRFIMATRNNWLRQRMADCEQSDNSCAPITWSISPHLARIAPDVLDWYHEKSRQTGKDYFILPPSGHLYAYPTSLAAADQDRFVAATEQDARFLGINSTVHWDWNGTWSLAETQFLPKYAHEAGAIRGVFPINVPFMLPTFTWWEPDRFYRVLTGEDGSEIVVFRPRQWRGVDDSGRGATEPFFLNPEKMADELGGYPPGTVTWVYMTSDGGLSLENSFMQLVKHLPAQVQLVSADAAAKLALQAEHQRARED